ncbi:MAG: type II toxin-antitoxin system RelE/ParE family toxin [Bacteroidota bacterium]|nr:MAG: type II toxin-antitoxin system RelE/ParE family toxin [Bacteroidota bacterium]
MDRTIKLSKRTTRKLEKLLEYLESEWSEKVKKDFIKKLDRSLNLIQGNPDSFEKTAIVKGLHRCVITKQTTIYYRYDKNFINIVTLFDTRQDHKNVKKEVR